MEVISPWILYFWTKLDSLKVLLGLPGYSMAFIGIFITIVVMTNAFGDWNSSDEYPDDPNEYTDRKDSFYYAAYKTKKFRARLSKYSKTMLVIGTLMILVSTAIPSKKDMAIIYVIPKIANNTTLQQEGAEIYNLAKSALKEYAGVKDK